MSEIKKGLLGKFDLIVLHLSINAMKGGLEK
jgi:hypothetical protein